MNIGLVKPVLPDVAVLLLLNMRLVEPVLVPAGFTWLLNMGLFPDPLLAVVLGKVIPEGVFVGCVVLAD